MAALWRELARQATGLQQVETVLRYLLSTGGGIEMRDVEEAVSKRFPEGEEAVVTIAETLIRQGECEGRREGQREGQREGKREGRREGLLQGIGLGLELRFGLEGLRLLPEISAIENPDALDAVYEGIRTAKTIEELRRFYRESASGQPS